MLKNTYLNNYVGFNKTRMIDGGNSNLFESNLPLSTSNCIRFNNRQRDAIH